MKKTVLVAFATALLAGTPMGIASTPDEDMKAFRKFFQERFPDTEFDDFKNAR